MTYEKSDGRITEVPKPKLPIKMRVKNSLDNLVSEVKSHKKLIGVSAAAAIPEMYTALEIARSAGLIPTYMFDFVYIQHAAVSIPLLYPFAVGISYIDLYATKKAAEKIYGKAKSAIEGYRSREDASCE